jgi:hypothetical protein
MPAAPAALKCPSPRLLTGRSKADKRMAAAFGRRSKGSALPALPADPTATGPPPGQELPDKVLVFSQWTGMLDLVEVGASTVALKHTLWESLYFHTPPLYTNIGFRLFGP